tara:strand:+ start:251 stop:724 length:474 start_codon:yes stop_codon:yes gene_type:complete
MAYIDIISLEQAKVYLRVDDTLTEDDNGITRMINAAFKYIETYTDVLVFARGIDYDVPDGLLKLYQYPINTDLTALTGYTYEKKGLYYNFCEDAGLTAVLTLNMGFDDVANIPQDLIEVAYELIDLYYYGEKDGKAVAKKLSSLSVDVLNQNKRFLV